MQRVRGDDGGWWLRDYRGPDATLVLATAPLSIKLSGIHNGIVWEVDDPRRFPPRIPVRTATVEEYLASERSSNHRHEYLRGEVFLMGEPSPEHEAVLNNVAALITAQLAETRFQSRVRPHVAVGSTFITYPDMAIFGIRGESPRLPRTRGIPPASSGRVLRNPSRR